MDTTLDTEWATFDKSSHSNTCVILDLLDVSDDLHLKFEAYKDNFIIP